jgi:hypothetical protein
MILQYFARPQANRWLIPLWPPYYGWRHETFLGNFSLEDLAKHPHLELGRCLKFLGCNDDITDIDINLVSNKSESKKMPTRFYSLLKRLPSSKRINRFMARAFPSWYNKLTSKPITRPSWNRKVLEKIIQELEEDSKTFLSYCHKPVDFWDFQESF